MPCLHTPAINHTPVRGGSYSQVVPTPVAAGQTRTFTSTVPLLSCSCQLAPPPPPPPPLPTYLELERNFLRGSTATLDCPGNPALAISAITDAGGWRVLGAALPS